MRVAGPHLVCVFIYLALALAVTYPLWVHPASRIQSLGDPLLNAYILDWVQFALVHQVYEFFQATIFWPNADALAYGEHLLVPAVLAAPFRIFTGSAVAIHNLAVVQAYFFCALAAHALGFHFFRRIGPALVAGLVYGFARYRIGQSGHVQLIHGEFLPLMVLAFERAIGAKDRRWLWLLGASALGQWLTSWYWAVFSFWFFVPYAAMRLWHRRAELNAAGALRLIVPFGVAAVLALPMAIPYARLKSQNAFYRPEEASAGFAAKPLDFFRLSSRYVPPQLDPYIESFGEDETALSMGILPLLAILLAVVISLRSGPRVESPEFPLRTWLALTLMLLCFCFGSTASAGKFPLPYALVEKFFPFAGSMRVPARWMLPGSLGISMIAAFAAFWGMSPWRVRPVRAVTWGLLVILIIFSSPFYRVRFVEVSAEPAKVYAWLAEQPFPSPVFEMPIGAVDDNRAMLHATWHRQPVVNGSNGFFPFKHRSLLRELEKFPAPEAVAKLREIRVKYVVVDGAAMWGTEERERNAGIAKLRARLEGVGAGIQVIGEYVVVDLGQQKKP